MTEVGATTVRDTPQAAGAALEFVILGMSCAACASRVERKLNALDGATAVVNFATERAVVTGLGGPDAVERVTATVERTGYRAVPDTLDADGHSTTADEHRRARLRSLRLRILVSALLTLPLSNLTIALAVVPWLRFPGWEWVCLALATPVVVWAAWPFHRATWRNLRHGSTSMDTLVSLGVATAYLWALGTLLFGDGTAGDGYWLGWGKVPAGADAFYLEAAASVTTFLLIGRYFELRARGAASDVLGALRSLAPKQARVRRDDGRDVVLPLTAVHPGDVIVTRPGEVIAADGIVTAGGSTVDTSAMTGESTPQEVSTGDRVYAGTMNLVGVLEATTLQVGSATQVEQMALLAEQAQARKAKVQRLVDRVVAVFVPVVLGIAALTFVGWLVLGGELPRAVSAALSVLVIACPCALGLATPTAIMVGIGRAGQLGIVVKGPDAFETSGQLTTVVLDKTGTVTTGELRVHEVLPLAKGYNRALLEQLGSLAERDSEHPVGRAIAALVTESPASTEVSEVEVFAGYGIAARLEGRAVQLGSLDWLASRGVVIDAGATTLVRDKADSGFLVVPLAVDHDLVGLFCLRDTLRDSAPAMVRRLRGLGLRTILLTGDGEAPARQIGDRIGVDAVLAGVLPTQKAAAIEELQGRGERVAMVGDGINDAAALATADLGIAVATGTDLAMRAADVIVVRRQVGVIADAVELSRRTMRTIRGNLIWAFGYNVAAIPLAAAGWLNPIIAGFAMAFSSLFVVANSLRLRNFTPSDSSIPATADDH